MKTNLKVYILEGWQNLLVCHLHGIDLILVNHLSVFLSKLHFQRLFMKEIYKQTPFFPKQNIEFNKKFKILLNTKSVTKHFITIELMNSWLIIWCLELKNQQVYISNDI